MFVVKVDKVITLLSQSEKMTSGSVNAYVIEFQFSEEWETLYRIAVFRADGGTPYNIPLDYTNKCLIPWEVLVSKGSTVEVGVYGVQGGEIVLPTIWTDIGKVLEGVVTGVTPGSPTQDLYYQLLSGYDWLRNELENLKNGWVGEPGVGEPGLDGKSAYELAVEQGFEGTLDEWLESLKGEPGKDGLDGTNGVDGKDATINGINTLEIKAGSNIEINQNGSIMTISSTSAPSTGDDSVSILEGSIPIKPLTADEYDKLSEEDRNSETGWLITDSDESTPSAGSGSNSDNADIYSTNETLIGKWVDGKPLYRKIIKIIEIDVDGMIVVWVDDSWEIQMLKATFKLADDRIIPVPSIDPTSFDEFITIWYDKGCDGVVIYWTEEYNNYMAGAECYVILEYTKKTDSA